MNYQIMSQKEIAHYMRQPHNTATAVISISDMDNAGHLRVACTGQNGICFCLSLVFDDVDRGNTAMSEKDAMEIALFVQRVYPMVKQIIVQCGAGISRSAGVCAAIMKTKEGDDSPVFDNPRYCPNMLCYRLVMEAFSKL